MSCATKINTKGCVERPKDTVDASSPPQARNGYTPLCRGKSSLEARIVRRHGLRVLRRNRSFVVSRLIRFVCFKVSKPMRVARTKHVLNFKPIVQAEVPHGRHSKHRTIVTRILSDLDRLEAGAALQVPLSQLNDSKERVRSALYRASAKYGRRVATASDRIFLYVWNGTR
jgi:hypothetical protein